MIYNNRIGRFFVYCYFEMNVLRWCPFVHLFDTPFQKSPYGHGHLLLSCFRYGQTRTKIGYDKIWEREEVKLLGATIDNNLKFDDHLFKFCSKAKRKLRVLSRSSKFLSFEKRRILLKAFVESQFKYCPLL